MVLVKYQDTRLGEHWDGDHNRVLSPSLFLVKYGLLQEFGPRGGVGDILYEVLQLI